MHLQAILCAKVCSKEISNFVLLLIYCYTCSCRRCPRVKYLSRTIRVPITFCMASQCLVLKAEFRKLVMTGMPCLKLVTFCLSLGMTLLGGKPEIGNIIIIQVPIKARKSQAVFYIISSKGACNSSIEMVQIIFFIGNSCV